MTTSASCSIEPDSRRSLMRGRWPSRPSLARLSCESAITGTFSSRDRLDAARDLADLLLAAVGAGVVHELHVIDHHALDVVLKLQPSRFGAQIQRREPGRVIDPDRRFRQLADDVGEVRVFVALEHPLTELVSVDLPAAAQHALGEL